MIVLVLLLSVSLIGCNNEVGNVENGDETVKENQVSKLPTLSEFSLDNIQNKAILLVKKGEAVPHLEEVLLNISKEHNVTVEKVEFNEEVESFVEEQVNYIKDVNLDDMYAFEQFIYENYEDNFNDIYWAIEDYVNSKFLGEEKEEDYKALVESIDTEEEKVKQYIDGRIAYMNLKIKDYIEEENLPILLLFTDQEIGRIQGFSKDKLSLHWNLYNNNILDLSLNNPLETIANYAEEKKDFIVTYGMPTCPYCAETEPIVKELAEKENLDYVDVNLNAIYVSENFFDFMEDIEMKEDISQTPTVIFYKEGKEVERIVGYKTRTELVEFINRNK